ncbi:hypothetical protein EYF80_022137 [Liparis tanakae]|uniref:Uncharacterized protein n=1 Tax=Liparis tanakae TaxID=230148 RepID=A0A4Z2HRQ7_9TELE|nr:hypothetical protein EYF80_022137 [Liparis tanakae]
MATTNSTPAQSPFRRRGLVTPTSHCNNMITKISDVTHGLEQDAAGHNTLTCSVESSRRHVHAVPLYVLRPPTPDPQAFRVTC